MDSMRLAVPNGEGRRPSVPALKEQASAALGRDLARELRAAWPAFPAERFRRGLAADLESLELMGRLRTLAKRLERCLPHDFEQASDVLRTALRSATFDGWMTVPCGLFAARAGIDQPDAALPLLAELTPRWSSEFALRPFLERHPAETYAHLRQWTEHPDEHVRRLVSEGTRPRLPWARSCAGSWPTRLRTSNCSTSSPATRRRTSAGR
jgi:3-methyladenine DNA glycosylase AlkC